MLKLSLSLFVTMLLLFSSSVCAGADYTVVELSDVHLMVVPNTWGLEEETSKKMTILSYKEVFKKALLTLSARYRIKSVTPIEGMAIREELMSSGGSLTVGLILEVEEKE